ncbi:MAG: CAP domain-containing protein [Chitinophagales bacterium]|nr:CAP domain-containing protein [Chitinophagales bacterium]
MTVLPGSDINAVNAEQQKMLNAVNSIRESGCQCGRKYMAPVQKVTWNQLLYQSALAQADDMYQHDFFKHFSNSGLDIGQRLDQIGYNWKVAGENLGRGQDTFEEVLKDWLKSPSHCRMLMNPKVDEMGIARVQNYWVQHFGKLAEE